VLRKVLPELLDRLPPGDPRAVRSRRDLQRINRLMGNADILARALVAGSKGTRPTISGPVEIVELGGGDGTLLLQLAKSVAHAWGPANVTLIDQQALLTQDTRAQLARMSWTVEAVQADVLEWLAQQGPNLADVMFANLFLHHFNDDRLSALLRDASRQTRMFVACEPRRSGAVLAAASLTGFIGCNDVTVHDGRISVRAGFRDRELSALWPADQEWHLQEDPAGRFTHCFIARLMRNDEEHG
jgi:Methyltransferase domain